MNTHHLLLGLLAAPAAAQSWTPTNPDINGVIDFGYAFATNASGKLVGGASLITGGVVPAMWDSTGTIPLPILGGDEDGAAVELNDLGQAVGRSTHYQQVGQLTYIFDHPVWWTSSSVVLDLRTLVTGGDNLELFYCADINNQQQIIGQGRIPPSGGGKGIRGFLFENGIVKDIGDLNPSGYASTEVATISEKSEIVGSSTAVAQFMHAFVWKNGVMTDLHDFAQMPGRNSHAFDINSQGVICGSGDFGADFLDFETGVLWKNGVITNLGSLAPGQYWAQAFAFGINDLEQVVGATNLTGGEPRAFLWQNGVMSDLNDFLVPGSGWTLTSAEDITNDGRIVGQGFFHGALLPVVLLPNCDGTYTPLATGCLGSGSIVPQLGGIGCPSGGQAMGLEIAGGPGGAPGVLLFGSNNGGIPITPSCTLMLDPLLPVLATFTLQGTGVGQGEKLFVFQIAPGTPTVDLYSQAAILDLGVPGMVSATNPLLVHIQ